MKDKVLKYLWVGVIGGVLAYFGLFLYQVVTTIGSPYTFEYGEGWNLWLSDWWGKGGLTHIYPGKEELYFNMPYTPLYFIVTGVLFKVFGPSLLIGRLVSLFACLVSAGLVLLVIRRITGNKWFGLLGLVLFFMPPIMRSWPLWFKTETLALMLSLLGLYLVVRFSGTRKVLWAVIPVLLAVFTKQTFIAAGVAVGLYLLITNWKLFLQYSGLVVVGGLGGITLLQWLSGGNFLDSVFVGPTMMPKYWELVVYTMGVIGVGHWIILILAGCAVVLFARRLEWKGLPTLFIFYFLVSTAMCAFVSSKAGGWVTYAIEMMPAAMVLIPILVWKLKTIEKPSGVNYGMYVGERKYPMNLSTNGVFQIVIPVLLLVQLFMLPNYYSWSVLPKTVDEDYRVAYEAVNSVGSKIYSEHEDLLFWTGRDNVAEPSYLSYIYRSNIEPLVEMVENKELSLIVQEWDLESYWSPKNLGLPNWMPSTVQRTYTMAWARSTDELAGAIKENYQLKEHAGKFWIYEPKP